MRRLALGVVLTLVVARPLVFGEDPGRLGPLAGPSHLLLTQLWFVAGVLWAGWRIVSRQETWRFGWPEIGLLGMTLCIVASAAQARYAHAAWLATWDWLAIVSAFWLVRQLVRSPEENQGLATALLATAVAVAGTALYQPLGEYPRQRAALAADPVGFRRADAPPALPPQHIPPWPDPAGPFLLANDTAPAAVFPANWPWASLYQLSEQYADIPPTVPAQIVRQRLDSGQVSGPFVFATTLAGYLLLLTPAWCGALWLRWRTSGLSWVTGLTGAAAALLVTALALTQFWHPVVVSWVERTQTWSATWQVLEQDARWGIGLANLPRHLPGYLPGAEWNQPHGPSNFVLEVLAGGGWLGLAALGVVLLAFLARVVPQLSKAHANETLLAGTDDQPAEEREAQRLTIRWEFYMGGVFGLILAFALRTADLNRQEILWEGGVAGGRALMWFGVFALLEGVPWSRRLFVGMLALGVVLLLLYWLVADGFFLASLAVPLWVVVAIVLNVIPDKDWLRTTPNRVVNLLPLPLTAALATMFFLMIYYPVLSATHQLHQARRHYEPWTTKRFPLWQRQITAYRDNFRRQEQVTKAAEDFFKNNVVLPLHRAADQDASWSEPYVQLAYAYAEMRKLPVGFHGFGEDLIEDRKRRGLDYARRAVAAAQVAQSKDPNNPEGYLAEYRVRWLFAQTAGLGQEDQYQLGVEPLQQLVERFPFNPYYRFLLADTYTQLADYRLAQEQAEQAWKLLREYPHARPRLNDWQREQLLRWRQGTSAE